MLVTPLCHLLYYNDDGATEMRGRGLQNAETVLQYFVVVPIGWLQSVIGYQCHFCVTFSIPNSVYKRFRVRGEGGRLESPTGRDLAVFSVVRNTGYRKSLHAIGTSSFNPALSVHVSWRCFPLGTKTFPPFLALNCPNMLYSSLPRSKRRCFS